MGDQATRLNERATRFGLDVIALIQQLPATEPGPTIRRQLAKSATSVSANHRAACRSRTHAEFTSRISIVAEEADECLHWLGVIKAAKLLATAELARLEQEARELTAIFSASVGTARLNERRRTRGIG